MSRCMPHCANRNLHFRSLSRRPVAVNSLGEPAGSRDSSQNKEGQMIDISRIDRALRQAVDSGAVPGVVAMAADAGGLVYEGAFGQRSLAGDTPMSLDTVFWIASMTKAVTSVAAMQLVERGVLALDAPIGELLPGLATPKVLEGFDPGGQPRLRPARRPITLRHLLTHTAGFSYNTWNPDMGRYMELTRLPATVSGRLAALQAPLVFDPGERWEYGINTDWVGQAVEAASGQRLDVYFREHIFAPLGMVDSGFALEGGRRARRAGMHQRHADGTLAPIDLALPDEPEFFGGGGALYSTARDYIAFTRMLLCGGRLGEARLLRPETVALMAENHIGELTVGMLRSAISERSNDAEFFPGMVKKWGLGFLINTEDAPSGRRAGSLTWAGLANTYYWIDPTQRVTGVILTQILPFADAAAMRLYADFERALYDAPDAG
jgi:methyl acetate hydrolase